MIAAGVFGLGLGIGLVIGSAIVRLIRANLDGNGHKHRD